MTAIAKHEVRLKGSAYSQFKRGLIKRDRECLNPICRWPEADLTVEHIIPRSRLRLDTEWNCVILCAVCNNAVKAGTLLIEWSHHYPGAEYPPRPANVFERDGARRPLVHVWEQIKNPFIKE